ncbi:MAG TPA: hypothetical protein VG246_11025 [Acidimicrobiales bacterium]|jgi:hypothetical protein|nr:hypothetical protein [Acidimicrobiales bacterium]
MLGMIFGPDLFVVVLLIIPLCLGLSIFAVVDVASHSKEDFFDAGYSKTAWIVVICVFTLFYGFGCLIAAFYLIAVRPKVARIETRRGPGLVSADNHVSGVLGYCASCGVPVAGAGRYCSNCGVAVRK